MPEVNTKTPNAMHKQSAATKRVKSTGLCKHCGNKITFCGRPFTADIMCCKCKYINQFRMSQQPVSCVAVDV
jgi:hypothetical protein